MSAHGPVPLSSEQESLLSTIIANPDEDTPRLAYADLLDDIGGESNQARAEFIRLQIRPDSAGFPDRESREARGASLLERHCSEWVAGVRGEEVTEVTFRRGFVDGLTTTADVFVRAGAEWWSAHPIRHVRLEEVRGWLDQLVAAPHLDNVRSLWLADEFRGQELWPLAESPRPGGAGRFPALEALSIGGWTEDDDFDWNGVSALAACEMPRLRDLDLINLIEDDRGADAVVEAPWFEDLIGLNIFTTWIGDAGLLAFLTSPRAKNLSFLGVGYGRVTARVLHALAELSIDAPLRSLSLVGSCKWVWDDNKPLATEWEVDPDRLGAVLAKHPALEIDLMACPIPPAIQTVVRERFGDRVSVGSAYHTAWDDPAE